MNTKTHRNWTYITAVVIVYAFLAAAAAGSFLHIVETSHKLGLDWEAWTVPFLIDGIALMGKLGRSNRFAAKTQQAGMRLMLFGGTLSLAANVYAGDNTGQRAYGVLLVVGFLVVEWYAGKLSPAPAAVKVISPEEHARRSEAAQKAAATRKANAEAAAAKAKRRPRRPVSAPVSPGVDGVYDPALGYAPASV